MSVVAVRVGKSGITIGADSIRISGWGTQEKDKSAKLFRISNTMILGAVGSCSTTSLFRDFIENHLPKTNNEYGWTSLMKDFAAHLSELKSSPKFEDSDYIVVYKGKAFFLGGYFIREIKDYYALGAGMDYALAALYLGADVSKAIKAACHLSIFCEEPINVIQVDSKKTVKK